MCDEINSIHLFVKFNIKCVPISLVDINYSHDVASLLFLTGSPRLRSTNSNYKTKLALSFTLLQQQLIAVWLLAERTNFVIKNTFNSIASIRETEWWTPLKERVLA